MNYKNDLKLHLKKLRNYSILQLIFQLNRKISKKRQTFSFPPTKPTYHIFASKQSTLWTNKQAD